MNTLAPDALVLNLAIPFSPELTCAYSALVLACRMNWEVEAVAIAIAVDVTVEVAVNVVDAVVYTVVVADTQTVTDAVTVGWAVVVDVTAVL